MKACLTIAGSDSSGGAGIQADLKTFAANGVYGTSVITAVTAQNTQRVIDIKNMCSEIVKNQIDAVLSDIEIDAVKIGMVSNESIMKVIYNTLTKYNKSNIILDPVMISTSGSRLLDKNAVKSLVDYLFKISILITPNIPEAENLTNIKISKIKDMEKTCIKLRKLGAKSVLLKGGHLKSSANDVLFYNEKFYYFKEKRIITNNTHGTGCTLSSAIAANLAKGYLLPEAVKLSKDYLTNAIKKSYSIGNGNGPVNHFYEYEKGNL